MARSKSLHDEMERSSSVSLPSLSTTSNKSEYDLKPHRHIHEHIRHRSASLTGPPPKSITLQSSESQLHQFPPPAPFSKSTKKSDPTHTRNLADVLKLILNQPQQLEDIDDEEEEPKPRGRGPYRVVKKVNKPDAAEITERRSQSRNKLVERSHIMPPFHPRRHSRSPSMLAVSPLSAPPSNRISYEAVSTISHNIKPSSSNGSTRLSIPLPVYTGSGPGYSGPKSAGTVQRRYESQYYYPRSPSRSHSRPPSPRPRPTVGHSSTSSLPRSFSSPTLMSSSNRFSSMGYYSNLLSRSQGTTSSPISPSFSNALKDKGRSPSPSSSHPTPEVQRQAILPTRPIVAPVNMKPKKPKY